MAISNDLPSPKPYMLMAIDLNQWSHTVKLRNKKANCTSYKIRPCDLKAILKLDFRYENRKIKYIPFKFQLINF